MRPGRTGTCPSNGWGSVSSAGLVASTAWRMSWVAASGWDTNETWEAATSTIVAFARSAINRWSAGGIALSWVPLQERQDRAPPAPGGDRRLVG
jgi:hypothetical protein